MEKRTRTLLVFVVLVLVGAGGVWWFWFREGSPPEPPRVDLSRADPKVRELVESARQKVVAAPDDGKAWGLYGLTLFANELWEPALPCFEQAEKLEPHDPRWPYFQGLVLIRREPAFTVIPYYQRALSVSYSDKEFLRVALAELYLDVEKWSEAEALLHEVLKSNPNHPVAHLGLARVASSRSDIASARKHLRSATSSPYTRRRAWTMLAALEHRAGNMQAAAEASKKTEQLGPDGEMPDPFQSELFALQVSGNSVLETLRTLELEERYREAQQYLHSMRDKHPYLHSITLGMVEMEQGRFDQAESAFREAIRLEPKKPDGYFHLGESLRLRKEYSEAVKLYEQGLAQASDEVREHNALAFHGIGECYFHLGQDEKALRMFETAVRYLPHRADVHYRLGQLHDRAKNSDKAVHHLRRALELDEKHEAARQLLDEVRSKSTEPGS